MESKFIGEVIDWTPRRERYYNDKEIDILKYDLYFDGSQRT